MRKLFAVLGLLLLALLITACTLPVKVRESVFPAPAIDPIPAKVAVVYGKEFRTYVHIGPSVRDAERNDISHGVNHRLELGASNVNLFDQLTENMFERSKSYNSWEALKAAGAVDFTHEIAQHPAVQEHQAAVSELVRQVEEYDFDTALRTLRQLMHQFIADSNG